MKEIKEPILIEAQGEFTLKNLRLYWGIKTETPKVRPCLRCGTPFETVKSRRICVQCKDPRKASFLKVHAIFAASEVTHTIFEREERVEEMSQAI